MVWERNFGNGMVWNRNGISTWNGNGIFKNGIPKCDFGHVWNLKFQKWHFGDRILEFQKWNFENEILRMEFWKWNSKF